MTTRRDQVVDAALAVAQQRGLGAMSMRAVAEQLGLTVMALYRHVETKEALLDQLVGRLLTEIELPDPAEAWQQRLRHLGGEFYDLARRYPTVVPLLLTRPYVTPDAVRIVHSTSSILHDAGIRSDQVPRLERMVSTFLLGYTTSAGNHAFWSDPAATKPPSVASEPITTRAALSRSDPWRRELDLDITDLIALVEQLAQTLR